MNGVEYVRDFCKKKGIAISKLERDLGYSNGYLNPKKNTKIGYDRAVEIAEYLQCDIEKILGKKPPFVIQRPEKATSDVLYGDGASLLLTAFSLLNDENKTRLAEYAKQLYVLQEMAKEEKENRDDKKEGFAG